MSNNKSRRIWQSPWGYAESIALVAGIAVIGMILQLAIGSFNFFILAKPVNKIAGLLILHAAIFLGISAKINAFARWISSAAMSVTLIIAILILTIIMGLTPQVGEGVENYTLLGFDSMTRNWSFVLLYTLTLISLGTTVHRRARRLKFRDLPFVVQHLGLWLVLAASGLGYADMERYIMYVSEGETEWRVYSNDNQIKELPLAITLHDFDMELYEPKLAIVDRATGAVQPEGAPQYFQIDADITSSKIDGWNIELHEYIHKAVRAADSTYRHVPMPGATPAARISAERDGETLEGWVCGGNQMQYSMPLPLSEQFSVVMTPAEPRKFSSQVDVYTQEGESKSATIEVNKPLRIDSWTIYQYGYDNAAGALSTYSAFELVYDPWIGLVYVGIILMMLGAACMVVQGRNREGVKL